MSDLAQLTERVLGLVADRADAQVVATSTDTGLTRFANSAIHQNVGDTDLRIMLQAWVNGRPGAATTTRRDADGLNWLVSAALAAAEEQPVDIDYPGLAPPRHIPGSEHYDPATASAVPQDRAEIVKSFVSASSASEAAGYCATHVLSIAYANSEGQHATARTTRATIDGVHTVNGSAGSGHQTALRLADLDGAAIGEVAASRAREAAEPTDLGPGVYEVVLSPECTATIFLWLALWGFNGKAVAEGRSFVEIGEQQFDPQVSFWDDATDPRALSIPFDYDGMPKQRTDLIVGGVSTAVTHDRRTGKKLGASSTGNALPPLPGFGPMGPLPTDLFVGEGNRSIADMVGSVERGLYISTFNYTNVGDPRTMVATGLTRNGTFLISDGERVGGVKDLRFTQSLLDAIGDGRVLGIESRSLFADPDLTGAGPVMAPAIHLAEWNFTGGRDG